MLARLCKIHGGILPDSRNKKCYHLQDALCLLIVAVVFEIYEVKGFRGKITEKIKYVIKVI